MSPATKTDLNPAQLDQLAINTIRFLSVDAVQKANSGHPGLPLGAAPMAYVLWTRFLRHNPIVPQWFNRDRFVLSAGHGSALLYSLLHLTGYDLPLNQIEQFRQWGSITPGHPERGLTPGVETTTGPLGQGFGNGVGMAIAEAHLAARYNRPHFEIVDHFTYGLVSDGDLMEGVSSEAASLAGQLELGKLIYLFDNNHVTLSAGTNIACNEDHARRFEAYGWHTQSVEDGNDVEAIDLALRAARSETKRPSLILVRTHLGFGSPDKQDTFEAHGSPLGVEEVKLTKQNLGWPIDPLFDIPPEALAHFRQALPRGPACSISHIAYGVGIQRRVMTIEPQDQGQAHGNLRRRHGQDEEKHDLAVGLAPPRPCRHEGHACAVQHDFDRHQNENQVTAHQESGQPQREQDSRQNERVTHRNSCHSEPLLSRIRAGPGGKPPPRRPVTTWKPIRHRSGKGRRGRVPPVSAPARRRTQAIQVTWRALSNTPLLQ